MFSSKKIHEIQAKFAARDRVQAIIEFDVDGHIR
jgi:hypothetical protein